MILRRKSRLTWNRGDSGWVTSPTFRSVKKHWETVLNIKRPKKNGQTAVFLTYAFC